jgi:hypothetical protein
MLLRIGLSVLKGFALGGQVLGGLFSQDLRDAFVTQDGSDFFTTQDQ